MKGGKKASALKKIGPADREFVLDDFVLYNLNRTAATYNDKMSAALKSHGLNTMKWRILMLLADSSPSSVSELARRSVTKMPTLTRILTRMEEDGLVTRNSPQDDRRFVEITMTPHAAKTLRQVQAIGQRVYERAFEGASARDIGVVTSVLKRVRANLERSPFEADKVKQKSA